MSVTSLSVAGMMGIGGNHSQMALFISILSRCVCVCVCDWFGKENVPINPTGISVRKTIGIHSHYPQGKLT